MAIGLVFSLLLLLRAVSTGQTACSGPLILVVSENAETERAASTLVEYANGSSRGTCIAIDQDSNLTSSETCSATTGVDVGFCNFVFDNFSGISYTVRTECANTSTNPEDTFANREELCSTVTKITDYLGDFKSILDRTLVDVYLRSCQEKTVCLAAYMEWLCSTQLPLFKLGNDSIDGCNASDSKVLGNDGLCYMRSKPCLSVCHRVLQNCPYYLPSKYQSDEDLGAEFVFGGYPAFACPAAKLLSNNSSYSMPEIICLKGDSGADAIVSRVTTWTQMWTLSTILVHILWSYF